MDVVFKGFQSPIPLWCFLLLFIFATGLAWWTYKNIQIDSSYRYLLTALRSAVFFILLALLWAPFFMTATTDLLKPEILVFLDNSTSTSIQKGSYKGSETYRKVLKELDFENHPEVKFSFFMVDDTLRSGNPDSLGLQVNETNLSAIVSPLRETENAVAAILLSDGIFTKGRNPVFQLTPSDIPVYTIALGDTTRQKDIFIKNIAANRKGYLNTSQPVEVTVVQNGFPQTNIPIQLKNNGTVLETKSIVTKERASSQTITFQLSHRETGLQQFEIAIPPLQNEWSSKNNTRTFAIDVQDNKQHVLSLAFEIHPDIRLVRTLLAGDKNSELISKTWVGGNRFIEGDLETATDSLDLLIIHGYPRAGLSQELMAHLLNTVQNVPLLLMATPGVSYPQLQQDIDIGLPLSVGVSAAPEKVEILAAVENGAHPIMDLPDIPEGGLSGLMAPVSGLTLSPGSQMLFESKFEGRPTGLPLLAVQQRGNTRYTQITAYNWYKMNQSTAYQTKAFARQLLYNIISWTATKPDNRNLIIQPSNTSFDDTDSIILNGFLVDERGRKESDAQVNVQLSSEKISPKNYSMEPVGDGQYRLTVNPLPEGIYNFEARAQKEGRFIGEHGGQFSVSSSNAEYIDTQRNDELLKGLAETTGGTFYEPWEAANIWEDLAKKERLAKRRTMHKTPFYPYQHLFWFLIIVVLLGAEWGIRKYVALP